MRSLARLIFLICAVPATAHAQVEARSATPEDLGQKVEETVSIQDPMVLEISLGGDDKRKPLSAPGVTGRTYYEQKKFVVDKASVPKVTVTKRPGKKGGVLLEVAPSIKTGWFRQDLDVTIAVVQGGREVKKVIWDDLTVGREDSWANRAGMLAAGASSTSHRMAELAFGAGEFEALFAEGEAPKLRIILDVQGESEGKEE